MPIFDTAEPDVSDDTIPPRILIYGPEGIGKNTLGLEFPMAFTVDLERGTPPGNPVLKADKVPTFDALMEAIGDLIEGNHEFKTVIFDSLDRIEALIFQHLCEANNWKSIEQPGYGRGYKMALEKWGEFVAAAEYLNENRSVCVVFIAHSEASRFDDPTSQSYSRYGLRLNDKAAGIVKDKCDAILFLNQVINIKEQEAGPNKKIVKGESGNARWIFTEMRPAYDAKNRYGLPEKFKYDKGKGYEFLSRYLPAMDTPVTPVTFEEVAEEQQDDEQQAE